MMTSESASNLNCAVTRAADSVLICVYVQPKARREQWIGLHGDRIKLTVTEPPEKGKANDAVVRLVAAALHLAPSRVHLLRGETSRKKDLLVSGLDESEIRLLLSAAMRG